MERIVAASLLRNQHHPVTMSLRRFRKRIKRRLKQQLGLPSEKPSFTGKHYERARHLLLDTIDVLNAADIPYILDAGTLLGIVRDGDLIPWDNDIDLMLPASAVADLRPLLWRLRWHGWKPSRVYITGGRCPVIYAACNATSSKPKRLLNTLDDRLESPMIMSVIWNKPMEIGVRHAERSVIQNMALLLIESHTAAVHG